MRRKRDSSPGLDGLPYSAWARAGDPAPYVLIACIGICSKGDWWEMMPIGLIGFCIPKGTHDNDHNDVIRCLECTRPLNLSNTYNKLLATALNQPLADIAQ
eukprot:2826996-Pyramimonas_sp.AAC.1